MLLGAWRSSSSAFPFGEECLRALHARRIRLPVAKRRVELGERFAGVADHRHGAVLARIPAGGVDRDESRIAREGGPRAGGEVLQPRSDGEDYVGVLGERVGRGGADDAHRPGMDRIVMGERALARDGLDHRNPPRRREGSERLLGAGVAHAAAGDDQRPLCAREHGGGLGDLAAVGARARNRPDALLEERLRIVVGDFLDVLRQRDEGRAAIGRIEHGGDRLRQRRQDLRRMRHAVPVAAHGAERIVDGDGGVAEMLDLLKHRIGQAVGEGVAREDQKRQPVGMRCARGGDHVERAGSDRRGRHHHLAAPLRLGVADRREGHRLLVLPAPGRQLVLHRLEGLGEAGDVAVAEDAEHPAKSGTRAPSISVCWAHRCWTSACAMVRRRVCCGMPGPPPICVAQTQA